MQQQQFFVTSGPHPDEWQLSDSTPYCLAISRRPAAGEELGISGSVKPKLLQCRR